MRGRPRKSGRSRLGLSSHVLPVEGQKCRESRVFTVLSRDVRVVHGVSNGARKDDIPDQVDRKTAAIDLRLVASVDQLSVVPRLRARIVVRSDLAEAAKEESRHELDRDAPSDAILEEVRAADRETVDDPPPAIGSDLEPVAREVG